MGDVASGEGVTTGRLGVAAGDASSRVEGDVRTTSREESAGATAGGAVAAATGD